MADLKNSWKSTGQSLGHAFRDLGKTLIVSGKEGVDKAVDWAEGSQNSNAQQDGQPVVPQQVQYRQPVNPQPANTQRTAQPNFAADEIRKLAQLRDEGVITDEEFTAKKKQLLGI